FWPDAGPWFVALVLFWALFVLLGVWELVRALAGQGLASRKKQLQYVLAATVLGWCGGATNFLLFFNIPVLPVGNVLITGYVIIVAYAIIRHRLMDIRVMVSSAGIFICVYALSLGLPVYMMARGSAWPALVTAIILATGAPFIYSRLRRQAELALLKDEIARQDELMAVSGVLADQETVNAVVELLVGEVSRIMKVGRSAVYLYEGKDYARKAGREYGNFPELLAGDCPLVAGLGTSGVVLVEDSGEGGKFAGVPASVLVPLRDQKKLLGILCLGDKANGESFTDRDLVTLKVVAWSAAQAINNAGRMENREKTWFDKARDERLKDLGLFAAKVAHQMGNRLHRITGALSIFVDYFTDDFLHNAPREKFIPIIKSFVERSAALMEDAESAARISGAIRRSARVGAEPLAVRLKELVDGGRALAETKHPDFKYDFIQECDPEITIWANDSAIQDVFFNAIDNSLTAIKARLGWPHDLPGAFAEIRVRVRVENDMAVVELTDNGIGIKPDDLQHIFVPLWAAKGTDQEPGLGLSVMHGQVLGQNGTISLASEYQAWTRLTITLPLATPERIARAREPRA
ncbi:MAG: GAF domain-containing protein, partial [Candidatus Omnitrophica bacterium]|nr:GAF domain-containing protein [Candidatus Omnitrophota bacterium]